MVDERRRYPRARSRGAIRCESAKGKELVSRWLDLGSGGLFVETDEPPTAGTLLTLEIEIPGERAAASATGRVTWVREAPSADGKPAGMGVGFIDIDDTVRASIDRFLARETRSEAQAPSSKALPSRERTVQGVGLSAQTPAAAASPSALASREKTVLGVAPEPMSGPEGQPRQQDEANRGSLASVDDLPEWPDEPPEPAKAAPPAVAPSPLPPHHEQSVRMRKGAARGGVGAFVFLLVLLTMAGGGYVYRARLWPWVARYGVFRTASAPVAPTAMGTPGGASLPSAAAGESAMAVTRAAGPSASAKVDADAGAQAQPAALDASADVGTAQAPTHRPATHAPKHPSGVTTQAAADIED